MAQGPVCCRAVLSEPGVWLRDLSAAQKIKKGTLPVNIPEFSLETFLVGGSKGPVCCRAVLSEPGVWLRDLSAAQKIKKGTLPVNIPEFSLETFLVGGSNLPTRVGK